MTSEAAASAPIDGEAAEDAESPSPVPTLLRLCRPHRRALILIAVLAALGSVATIAAPLVYRTAVNDVSGLFVHKAYEETRSPTKPPAATTKPHRRGRVAPRKPNQVIRSLLTAVVLLFVVRVVAQSCALLADGVTARVASGVEGSLVAEAFERLLRFPLSFFSGRSSAALVKRVNQVDQVAPLVAAVAKDFLPEAFRVVGILVVIVLVNPRLAALTVATMPLYVFLSWRMTRAMERGLDSYYERWDAVSTRLQDALQGVKTVKLSGAEPRETGRLRSVLSAAYTAYLARNRTENRYILAQTLIVQLGQALVLGYGGWKVLEHQLTPGDVVMFVAYLDELFDPLEELTRLVTTFRIELAAVARAIPFVEAHRGEPSGEPLPPGPGRIEFRDVRFGYTPEREVLKGVTFTIEPGTVTALVGPSGAGKTTTVDLLLRLFTPWSGEILVDGTPLERVDPSSVRASVAVVSADGTIFRGTIAENVRYRRPSASDAEVGEAARNAGLGAAIARLPQGLGTDVGEGGVGLSVGERQRVLIARALVSKPRILVLDEATANLDFGTEAEVKQALAGVRAGRTMLVVAHRLSMVEGSDHVLVLDGGRLAEAGTFDQLAAGDGWFARFVRARRGGEST
jgi:ABC-type multidrug transport system fused ATPase/permease subunit